MNRGVVSPYSSTFNHHQGVGLSARGGVVEAHHHHHHHQGIVVSFSKPQDALAEPVASDDSSNADEESVESLRPKKSSRHPLLDAAKTKESSLPTYEMANKESSLWEFLESHGSPSLKEELARYWSNLECLQKNKKNRGESHPPEDWVTDFQDTLLFFESKLAMANQGMALSKEFLASIQPSAILQRQWVTLVGVQAQADGNDAPHAFVGVDLTLEACKNNLRYEYVSKTKTRKKERALGSSSNNGVAKTNKRNKPNPVPLVVQFYKKAATTASRRPKQMDSEDLVADNVIHQERDTMSDPGEKSGTQRDSTGTDDSSHAATYPSTLKQTVRVKHRFDDQTVTERRLGFIRYPPLSEIEEATCSSEGSVVEFALDSGSKSDFDPARCKTVDGIPDRQDAQKTSSTSDPTEPMRPVSDLFDSCVSFQINKPLRRPSTPSQNFSASSHTVHADAESCSKEGNETRAEATRSDHDVMRETERALEWLQATDIVGPLEPTEQGPPFPEVSDEEESLFHSGVESEDLSGRETEEEPDGDCQSPASEKYESSEYEDTSPWNWGKCSFLSSRDRTKINARSRYEESTDDMAGECSGKKSTRRCPRRSRGRIVKREIWDLGAEKFPVVPML